MFKPKSETADLWQPKWNENQTVLLTVMHTLDKHAGSLKGAAAGGWREWWRQMMRWLDVITINAFNFELIPGVGDGQGTLVCCDSWGGKESNTTEQLNWTELNWVLQGSIHCFPWLGIPVLYQLMFCMHFCVWRCIPDVSMETDVLHIHLLLCHLVLLFFFFFFSPLCFLVSLAYKEAGPRGLPAGTLDPRACCKMAPFSGIDYIKQVSIM